MSSTTARPARTLTAAVAALILLASCGGSSGGATPPDGSSPPRAGGAPPRAGPTSEQRPTAPAAASPAPATAPPAPTVPAPAPPAGSTGLVTYSSTAADAPFAFELPATWSVRGEFGDIGGEATVLGADGAPVAHLSILIAWGAECGPGCSPVPVAHLGDVPGSVPLSSSGGFVVRSVAMDLTASPEVRNRQGWQGPVRLLTSLTDADVPVPTAMLPHVMYGVGLVETGVVAPNGITHRTVIFSSVHDFATLQEARAYAGSEEHRQVEAMIASFRA